MRIASSAIETLAGSLKHVPKKYQATTAVHAASACNGVHQDECKRSLLKPCGRRRSKNFFTLFHEDEWQKSAELKVSPSECPKISAKA
jgi:hypothetical protein